MIYEFEVLGKIKGKARPRVNSYTGTIYTPTTTKDYECLIQQYFILKYPKFVQLQNRIKITIIAYMKIPKSTKKSEEKDMLENISSPIKKPDIDNIVKVVLDALNQFAFKDDMQITKLDVEKKYSLEEKIYIKIEEY